MKREVSFFKDKRAGGAQTFIDLCHAVGMSDTDIKAEMLKIYLEKRENMPYHLRATIHIPNCPKCGAKDFHVTPEELDDAGGVIACEYCETIITPDNQ